MDESKRNSDYWLAYYEGRINFIEQIGKIQIKFNHNNSDHYADPYDEVMILSACLIDCFAGLYYTINKKNLNNKNKEKFTKFLIQFGGNPFFEQIHPYMLIDYAASRKYTSKSAILIKKIENELRILSDQDRMFSFDELKDWISENKLLSSSDMIDFIKDVLPKGTGAAYFYDNFRSAVVHTGWFRSIHFGDITCNGKKIKKIDHKTCINALKNIFNNMRVISEKSGEFLKEIK